LKRGLGDYFVLDKEGNLDNSLVYMPHMSTGVGLKVAMNENFVLSVDWAMALDKQDNAKWANFYIKMGYLF
jgi:hemolysin activation/secretion protein